jgi:hypothetical protein
MLGDSPWGASAPHLLAGFPGPPGPPRLNKSRISGLYLPPSSAPPPRAAKRSQCIAKFCDPGTLPTTPSPHGVLWVRLGNRLGTPVGTRLGPAKCRPCLGLSRFGSHSVTIVNFWAAKGDQPNPGRLLAGPSEHALSWSPKRSQAVALHKETTIWSRFRPRLQSPEALFVGHPA